MSVLRSFASVDEMLSAMAEDNEVADSSTRPWQKALAVGDCFCARLMVYVFGVRSWTLACFVPWGLRSGGAGCPQGGS